MFEEFKEIIAKNLPSQVGDALKLRLQEADADKENVKRLQAYEVTLKARIKELEDLTVEYAKKDTEYDKIVSLRKDLEKREFELELTITKNKLENETDKSLFAKNLALGLVRNTAYREQVYKSENAPPFYDSKGVWIQRPDSQVNQTHDKIAE